MSARRPGRDLLFYWHAFAIVVFVGSAACANARAVKKEGTNLHNPANRLCSGHKVSCPHRCASCFAVLALIVIMDTVRTGAEL